MSILGRTYKAAKGFAAIQLAGAAALTGLGWLANAIDPDARLVKKLRKDRPVVTETDSEDDIPTVEETV